eukprot:5936001-Pleurochrysis_carterae.AAC.2
MWVSIQGTYHVRRAQRVHAGALPSVCCSRAGGCTRSRARPVHARTCPLPPPSSTDQLTRAGRLRRVLRQMAKTE